MISILEIRDGAISTQNEIWGQYAECLLAGLPAACEAGDLNAMLGGTALEVTELSAPDSAGNRTATLRLPDSVGIGKQNVRVSLGGAEAEIPVRILGFRNAAE